MEAKTVRKAWNFTSAQSEALHYLFESALSPLGTSALVLPEGMALHVRPGGPADIATLTEAACICQKYLKLKNRDFALTNDPYSGGTTLSDFTLVAGVNLDSANAAADALLVMRLPMSHLISDSNNIEKEGVRVPPMPLASSGKINLDLLRAISAHPAAPMGLLERVESAWAKMEEVILSLQRLARDPGSEFKRTNFKRYLSDSSVAFESLMLRLPLGSTLVTAKLPSGENLKLQVKFTERKLFFDFAGSDASAKVNLTDLSTFGACVASTVSAFNVQVPMNSGLFEHIQVSTTARTMLSGQAPAATLRGINEGIAAACDLVRAALAKLNSSLSLPEAATHDGLLQIEFKDGRRLSARVRPGGVATSTTAGTDAFASWSSQLDFQLNPEKIEKAFPVRVVSQGLRATSGAKGQYRGGDGEVLGLLVLEPATARWCLGDFMRRHDGLSGGRAGASAKVEIQRQGKTDLEEHLEAEGQISLNAGDHVFILGPGGGAYGATAESDSEKSTAD